VRDRLRSRASRGVRSRVSRCRGWATRCSIAALIDAARSRAADGRHDAMRWRTWSGGAYRNWCSTASGGLSPDAIKVPEQVLVLGTHAECAKCGGAVDDAARQVLLAGEMSRGDRAATGRPGRLNSSTQSSAPAFMNRSQPDAVQGTTARDAGWLRGSGPPRLGRRCTCLKATPEEKSGT